MAEFTGSGLACVRGERLVFEHVAFRLARGEALALTGPNGSGKSSLLRLMAGLIRPTAGDLRWDGAAVSADEEAHRARLHYVGHLDALKPALTVAENLAFYAALCGASARGAPARARLDRALEAFALEPLADLPARFLSQGQRHRTALARLIVAEKTLWLLDEPTLGLDDASVARLTAAITGHLAGGGCAVIATHAPLAIQPLRRLAFGAAS